MVAHIIPASKGPEITDPPAWRSSLVLARRCPADPGEGVRSIRKGRIDKPVELGYKA
jgi:hypothetical protein